MQKFRKIVRANFEKTNELTDERTNERTDKGHFLGPLNFVRVQNQKKQMSQFSDKVITDRLTDRYKTIGRFRLRRRPTNEAILRKIPKTSFLGYFWPFLAKFEFSRKIRLRQLRTDRLTDRQRDTIL